MEKSFQTIGSSESTTQTNPGVDTTTPTPEASQTWTRFCRGCQAQNEAGQLRCLLCEAQLPNPILVYRVGTRFKEKYEITRFVGQGAMGVVYEAEQLLLKRRVALKCLHPNLFSDEKSAQRFHREALAAANIEHPNVLRVIELEVTSEGAPILVTEFLDGQDLEHCLQEGVRVSPDRIVHLLSQALHALNAAHQKGIIHRDIKPQNLFITKQNNKEHLTVIDFGIAKLLEPQEEVTPLTTRGVAIGSPAYISPEQLSALPVDQRADLWSLGIILYQMLTGRLPFGASTPMGTALEVLKKEPDFSELEAQTGFYREMGILCRRVLSKNRDERPASAFAFQKEMQEIFARSKRQETLAPIEIIQTPAEPRRSYALLAGGVVFFGLCLLFLGPSVSAPQVPSTEAPPRQLVVLPPESSAPLPVSPASQIVAAPILEPSTNKAPKKIINPKTKVQITETQDLPVGQNKFSYAKGLVLSHQYKEAIPLLEGIIKEEPDNDSAHRWLGDAYFALGKKTLARVQWEEFLRLNPTHSDARKVRADIESLH